MHQTTISRKAIYIPHSVDVIALDELASRLAAALFQLKESAEGATQDMEADASWYAHAQAAKRFRHVLIKACEAGQLTARDNVAHMQCSPEEKGALLLVDDAANYLTASGSSVRITRHAEAIPFVGLHPDELVPLDDVPLLVATAMHDPEKDSEWHGFKRLVIEKRIYEAANCGGLAMLDQMTRQRLSIRATGACSTAGDLCAFFCNPSAPAEKGPPALSPEPVKLPAPVTWQGHTYQPGPEITPEEADEAAAWADAVNAAGELERKERREKLQQTWWGVTGPYIVSVMHEHQCTTAKNLFYKLEELAGESSPFKRGKEANRGALVVKELAQTVSLKTFQNRWKEIKKAALG